MDEERFNLELRKFLKRFGITSQREIEKAVAGALESGAIDGSAVLPVHATLTIPGVLPEVRIEGRIALSGQPTPEPD
jgi:hypothetical protein